MSNKHFWQGQRISDLELQDRIDRLNEVLSPGPFSIEEFYLCCENFSIKLEDAEFHRPLREILIHAEKISEFEASEILKELSLFLKGSQLRKKVAAEFQTEDPFRTTKVSPQQPIFECWAPIGILFQVMSGNDVALSIYSIFEGLITGNVNIVKLSSHSSDFTISFFELFFSQPSAVRWKSLVIIIRLSSQQTSWLQRLASKAHAVVVWGSEEAVAQMRNLTPVQSRFIDWSHRLSFSYVTLKAVTSASLQGLAIDICRLDQLACSSPQCIFLETDSFSELKIFSEKLATSLKAVSFHQPMLMPSDQAMAEIHKVVEVVKAEQAFKAEFVEVIEDSSQQWRVLVDMRPGLRASPLYRTIWVKPIHRNQIISTFLPLASYLQTVGLVCAPEEFYEISQPLIASGITRIRPAGKMLESYMGEPHDGSFALTCYMKRLSFELGDSFQEFAALEDLKEHHIHFSHWPETTMTKELFQNRKIKNEDAHLFFKSGGSSGEPKLSIFTYEDYHRQMGLAAEGLIAAGLNPATDRCINLFFGGGLYGGFLSFFTILEKLRAVQFPMAAHLDFDFVGDIIVQYQINVLLGMPSYLLQLFEVNQEKFKKACCIKKIYFGGEPFNHEQRLRLKNEFGVEVILSATYGSVDMGPLGYQCRFSEPGVHHLHQSLHHLEILKMESDQAVADNEAGRMVFSTLGRRGQELLRYDLGDLGRWVKEPCPCGRKSPRFLLQGRQGDVFKASGSFLNYNKINRILEIKFGYGHEMQILVQKEGNIDKLLICLSQEVSLDSQKVIEGLVSEDKDLFELVVEEKSLGLEVIKKNTKDFLMSKGSGKLLRVVDLR